MKIIDEFFVNYVFILSFCAAERKYAKKNRRSGAVVAPSQAAGLLSAAESLIPGGFLNRGLQPPVGVLH